MKTIKVRVTKEDISIGKNMACPIVFALQRLGFERVQVSGVTCSFVDKKKFIGFIRLSAAVKLWIRRFDLGKRVKPITFTLKVP